MKRRNPSNLFEYGGTAFPASWNLADGAVASHPGMTLRDWFAGQAIAGMFSICRSDPDDWPDAANIAANAYRYADALLASRLRAVSQP